jgi:hypothetical protein
VVGSVIFIVVVAALFVSVLLYGRNGRRDNWLTRAIISSRNGRVAFLPKPWDPSDGPRPDPSFVRTLAVSAAGLIAGLALAFTHTGGFWAVAFIIGAVIVPVTTAYRITKDGGKLRWTWRTSENDPSDRGPGD